MSVSKNEKSEDQTYHSYIWICKGPWTANIWRVLLTCTDEKKVILTQWAINIYEICYNQATRCFQTMRGKQLSLHFDVIQCNQDNGMHNTHLWTHACTHICQTKQANIISLRERNDARIHGEISKCLRDCCMILSQNLSININ